VLGQLGLAGLDVSERRGDAVDQALPVGELHLTGARARGEEREWNQV
jgi:hypothetical protein